MRLARALALAVVVVLVVWSGDAWAQGRRFFDTSTGANQAQHRAQHHGGHRDGHHRGHRDGHHGGHDRKGHHHHHRFPGSTIFAPFGFFPGAVYAAPVYSPPLAFAYPPPEPPLVRVVFFSTGRYVLYGDGMTSAYQWVWIPNAPPAPPPPPAGMPPPPPSDPPPAAPEPQYQVPAAPRELWTWRDEQGTAHWTDRRDNIPERYRAVAQRRG